MSDVDKELLCSVFGSLESYKAGRASVIHWLENYVKETRRLISQQKPISDFDAGELSGKIEALEVMLAEAKQVFAKKQAGEKK